MADFSYSDPLYAQKPEDDHSMPSSVHHVVRRLLMDMLDNCLPVKVVSYDRGKNVATVVPSIYKTDVNNEVYERGPIFDIPVLSLGGGGFHINFPITEGDSGWIIAADRDIDLFKQSLTPSKPNTNRAHTFADSWFIPDVMRKYVISGENTDDMVIQSTDTNARVAIGHGRIRISVGSTRITVTGGNVVIDASSAVVNADTTVNGNLTVNGSGSFSGPVSASSGTFGGISSETHEHTDSRGGTTSPPIA